MKPELKKRVRALRKEGKPLNEIVTLTGCSKGSASTWTRDIELTEEQKERISGNSRKGHWKGRQKIKEMRRQRWASYHAEAEQEWEHLKKDSIFMFGLALYVGEGGKTEPNVVSLGNCDPRVLCKTKGFFLQCGVPDERLRAHIVIHDDQSVEAAERYWLRHLGLLESQFQKTTVVVSKASKRKKGNIQPYGTCNLRAAVTSVRQKLERWMDLSLDDSAAVD